MLELPLLGQVHTKPDIFETAYFLSGILWTGPFNPSGEEFQDKRVRWADSLVSCGRKVDSCFKVCGSKNIRIRVNVAFKIQPFTLFLVLKSDIFFTDNKQLFRFLLASQSNKMSHGSLLSHNGPSNRKKARKFARRKAQWLYLFCYLKIL